MSASPVMNVLAEARPGPRLDPTPDQVRRQRDLSYILAGSGAAAPLSRRLAPRTVSRRTGLVLVAATAVAALMVAPTLHAGNGITHRNGSSAAAAVLEEAARTVSSQPVPRVPPGSFVFVASRSRSIAGIDGDDPAAQAYDRRIWKSAYGRNSGLLLMRIRGDKRWSTTELAGTPQLPGAYRDDLPTTTEAMLQYLYRHRSGGDSPRDIQAFGTIQDLITENYLPPAVMAAIFRAAGRIPGTRIIPGLKDDLDRSAVALGQPMTGTQGKCTAGQYFSPGNGLAPYCSFHEILFDSVDFTYLGYNDVLSERGELGPVGTVIASNLQQPPVIVARAGKLP